LEELTAQLFAWVLPVFHFFIFILHIFSILILMWGLIIVAYDFFRTQLSTKNRLQLAQKTTYIKNYFGSYVLLSLEILIAADIIESIINPTAADIFKLAAVVVIRTLISYFLNKEIRETEIDVDLAFDKEHAKRKTD